MLFRRKPRIVASAGTNLAPAPPSSDEILANYRRLLKSVHEGGKHSPVGGNVMVCGVGPHRVGYEHEQITLTPVPAMSYHGPLEKITR